MNWSADTLARIKQVPHFRDGHYADLDVPSTLDYFKRRFVDHCPAKGAGVVVADVGCGYGWLAMAFAAFSDAHVIAVDLDAVRLKAGKEIATLLGLANRIEWRVGSLTDIPLADREADVTYCVEVLEHVYRDARAFAELDRATGSYLVLTTPNGAFPVIQHDTRLPFCHWLPMRLRDLYARAAGRVAMQDGNRFWYPWDFARHLRNFRRVSGFFHFAGARTTISRSIRITCPYGRGEWRRAPSAAMQAYFPPGGAARPALALGAPHARGERSSGSVRPAPGEGGCRRQTHRGAPGCRPGCAAAFRRRASSPGIGRAGIASGSKAIGDFLLDLLRESPATIKGCAPRRAARRWDRAGTSSRKMISSRSSRRSRSTTSATCS